MLLLQEKCAQYWPEKLHDDITPGYKLSVTFLSSLPFAEYEIRKFRVKVSYTKYYNLITANLITAKLVGVFLD